MGWPQGKVPQDTRPCRVPLHVSGPPESPWEGESRLTLSSHQPALRSHTPHSYQVLVLPYHLGQWEEIHCLCRPMGEQVNTIMERTNQVLLRHWLEPHPYGPITGRGRGFWNAEPHLFSFIKDSDWVQPIREGALSPGNGYMPLSQGRKTEQSRKPGAGRMT